MATERSPSHREIKEAGGVFSDGVDLISSMHDVILQLILSYIPTRFAIRTSVLSKRWRHVWSKTPSLSFDWYKSRLKSDSINETLDRYTALKMTSFQLCTSTVENIPYIDQWIEYAMSRKVENISLHFGFRFNEYNIPDFFYINPYVKQLSIELKRKAMKIQSCTVSWTSIKKLSWRCWDLSDECIAKILSGCPILESLTLYLCNKLKVLDLSKSLNLKSLEIDNNIGMEQIIAPHIHCLRMRNYRLRCNLIDASSLIEARLDIECGGHMIFEKEDIFQVMGLKMLENLHNVNKLTLGENFLEMFRWAKLRSAPFPSFKVKDLTLETKVSHSHIPRFIEKLLQNSPDVKKLTVHGTISEECINVCLDFEGLNSDKCWSSKARIFVNHIRRNVESKRVASFLELLAEYTKFAVWLGGYIKERDVEELLEMVPMVSRDKSVSIVVSSTKSNQRVNMRITKPMVERRGRSGARKKLWDEKRKKKEKKGHKRS